MKRYEHLLIASLGVAVAAACVQFGGLFRPVPDSICDSLEIWTYQDKDSPLMNPGRSCVQCHRNENSEFHAPFYELGGTVMQTLHEADDCRGVARMTVVIEDDAGTVFEMPTNTAGNFWIDVSKEIVFPIRAKIIGPDGEVSEKKVPVEHGDCAACHTSDGANGARGRLVPPGTSPPEGIGGARGAEQ